jgi:hypothetical protein
MASSSNRRRGSSSQEASATKARVISVRRTDVLPRKGNVSASRRKPVADPPTDAPTVPPATPVVDSNKRARRAQQVETLATRPKTTRAAGRASGKLNRLPVTEVMPRAVEPVTTADELPAFTVLETPAVEEPTTVDAEEVVEVSAIMEEATIGEVLLTLPIEAATCQVTEIGRLPVFEEMREPSPARTAADCAAPAPPAPHHRKPALETVVLRLLSALRRWTGVRW